MKSKLAIFSFVLSIILIAIIPLAFIITEYFLPILSRGTPGFLSGVIIKFLVYFILYFVLFANTGIFLALSILAIVAVIISLVLIKKRGLEGKKYAWASLIISSVVFFYYLSVILEGGLLLDSI